MSDKSMRQIALEQDIAKVEEEIGSAVSLTPPAIVRRIELETKLERLNRMMALV